MIEKATIGKFVTIEGCEGVGKSTQLRLLKEYCERENIPALFTREPGGCEIAEDIRRVILNPENTAMTDMTELLLYAAARSQHTEQVIKPALAQGITVFCDRYTDSTAAYQGYARGIPLETVHAINTAAMCGVHIECTVFMDVPPEKGFARKGGAATDDRLERETLAFHKKVYEGFRAIIAADPRRFLCFAAQGTKYDTHAEIVAALRRRKIFG
ncbi:MAG: dTMP kinase [Clostridiales bacterium]|nr:dTMP kinase [Clostridiales bacterium]